VTLAERTARNTAIVVAARLVSKVLVFVVVVLAIRSLGRENFGRFSSLLVYAGLVSIIADLGFRPLFTREVARDHSRLTPYLNSILSLKLVLSLPALGVLALAIRLALPSLFPYLLPTFALLIATSFSNQLRATFYALGELRFEAFAILGESAVLLAGALVVVLGHFPWWAFLWVYALSYGFTVVYAAVVMATRLGHRFAFDLDWRRATAARAREPPLRPGIHHRHALLPR
jgi:O-antigen/teichoic acid export membrane protein